MPAVILAADRRECVVVRGRDARSFLQSQISQDLDALTPGAGARSLLLEPQGKLLASFRVLCLGPEEYLLDTDQGVGSVLVDGLRRFMIRVAVEVVSADDLRIVEVRGNGVDAVLGACGWTAPPEPGAHELVTDAIRVVRAPWPPVDGVDLVVAASQVDATVGALVAAGATVLDAAATETLRIESGVVRQGADIDPSTIAHEAHLDLDAVSFDIRYLPLLNERVEVTHLRPHGRQVLCQRLCGGLALIGDIRLVGDPDDQDIGTLHRLTDGVQKILRSTCDVLWHPVVDSLCCLDEQRWRSESGPHVVGEVHRIDRNTVSTHPGAWVEGLESERLGLRELDHIPKVDPEPMAELHHLVHQANVDLSVGVLQQLGHLCFASTASLENVIDELSVEVGGAGRAIRSVPSDNLWSIPDPINGVSRIDALWRECQREVLTGGQPRKCFEDGTQFFISGAGVGGGLEHHQLS